MEVTLLYVGLVNMKQLSQVKIKVKMNPKPVVVPTLDVNLHLQNVTLFPAVNVD